MPPCPAWMWSLTWPDPTAACRVTGRAGVAPCRGSCAHPAYGLLTLPCSSQPSREMSCARSTVSTAQPGWQPGPGAGGHEWLPSRPATMHGAPRHPLPALVLGRAQGASPCPLGTWHGEAGRGSQAFCPARHCPMALPGMAVPSIHNSPIFSGTWGLQCHAQAGHSPMSQPVQAGCPPTQESAVGLPSWQGAPAACKGSQSHHALTEAPGFNPCHAAAHCGQLWQSRQPGQAAPSPQSSAQPRAHPVLPAATTGLSQW